MDQHVLSNNSYLSDDCSAWDVTANIGYQKPQKVSPSNPVNKGSKKEVGTSNPRLVIDDIH